MAVCAQGSAFLYARREVQHPVEPLVVSWGWEVRRRIQALTGLPGTCPDSPEWYAQMADASLGTLAAFSLPPCGAAALQRRLYDEYRVEAPALEWPALGRAPSYSPDRCPVQSAAMQRSDGGTGGGRQLLRV